MIKIAVLTFNPFGENTYVVSDPTGEAVIIDAGNYSPQENAALEKYVAQNELKPTLLINTHGHVDHMLGVEWAKTRYGIPFALRREDDFLIESCQMHGRIYGFQVEKAPAVEFDLSTTDEVRFGESRLEIIHTPGHTPGHVCFFDPGSRSLFSGDTLFKESIGRTDLPGGDYSWIMKSILEKIVPLGDDVKLYPGHGLHSDIGHEVLYNPFITEVVQGDVKY